MFDEIKVIYFLYFMAWQQGKELRSLEIVFFKINLAYFSLSRWVKIKLCFLYMYFKYF